MKYLLLVLTEPVDDIVPGGLDIEQWVDKYDASGVRFFGDRLAPAAQGKTVRIRADGEQIADGPFSDSHARLAGIDILECDSLNEAVQVALAHPMAREGVIEVRPFFDWDADTA